VSEDVSASGIWIREARKVVGLSQAQLAERTGIARSLISAYETGTKQPTISVATRLLDAAGVDMRQAIAWWNSELESRKRPAPGAASLRAVKIDEQVGPTDDVESASEDNDFLLRRSQHCERPS
jgi:transcriptional regulator with XRE-family HTH domain